MQKPSVEKKKNPISYNCFKSNRRGVPLGARSGSLELRFSDNSSSCFSEIIADVFPLGVVLAHT